MTKNKKSSSAQTHLIDYSHLLLDVCNHGVYDRNVTQLPLVYESGVPTSDQEDIDVQGPVLVYPRTDLPAGSVTTKLTLSLVGNQI